MPTRDLLSTSPHSLTEERFETLLSRPGLSLQRIVSPPAFRSRPFLQPEDEWVLLLQGQATLDLDGEQIELRQGESLLIAAGTPHRVITTSTNPLCIWIALHLPEAGR
ncbi:MAG: cupin domain-containing protein [Sedimenticola sp.]|nr:cupin domain-containing protein [Sedimenticola sp.]